MTALRNLALLYKLICVLSSVAAFQTSNLTASQVGGMTSILPTVEVNLSAGTGPQSANASAYILNVSSSLSASSLHRTSSFAATGFNTATSLLSTRYVLPSQSLTLGNPSTSFLVFTRRSITTLAATGFHTTTSFLSVVNSSLPSRSTVSPSTSLSSSTVEPKITFVYTPGTTSNGTPLPLLAKILIPVAGVLLIVIVVLTWYCCGRRKDSRHCDDLVIESTLMVRLDVSEEHVLSS